MGLDPKVPVEIVLYSTEEVSFWHRFALSESLLLCAASINLQKNKLWKRRLESFATMNPTLPSDKYSNEDRKGIAELTRGLRRLKRQLLLNQVQDDPARVSPAASLREILVKVACSDDIPPFPTAHSPSITKSTRKARSWSFEEEPFERECSSKSVESLRSTE